MAVSDMKFSEYLLNTMWRCSKKNIAKLSLQIDNGQKLNFTWKLNNYMHIKKIIGWLSNDVCIGVIGKCFNFIHYYTEY